MHSAPVKVACAPFAVDDAELAVGAAVVGGGQPLDRPPRRTALRAAARARRGRSAGSRRPGSRSRRRAAPPTARPSRRRGTSTASRRPTGRPRGRRRRSSRSRRPAQPYVSSVRSSVEQCRVVDERRRDLGPRERRLHLVGGRAPHDDGPALGVRAAQRLVVDASSTSASSRSRSPSSAISGTRRPVAPNQRSLTASMLSPGWIASSFARRQLRQRVRRAGRAAGRSRSGTAGSAGCRAARARARPPPGPS